MPRPTKPARLWLRPATATKQPVWVVLDKGKEVSTRCGAQDRAGAEAFLEEYLGIKRQPSRRRGQDIEEILLADVLSVYLRDKVPSHTRPDKTAARIEQLLLFWGDKVLADIDARACMDYAEWRQTHAWKSATKAEKPRMVSAAGARRELEDLQAAINWHKSQRYHSEEIIVWLPPRSPARTRYLRRDELAKLVWLAWRQREGMVVTRGARKGQPVTSKRRPWRHIARFLLVGAYTGTRAAAIAGAAFEPTRGHGWIDVKTGLFYRAQEGAVQTNKRQPTILVPRRLLRHIRRWKRKNPNQRFVVEWNGKPVTEVNKGFRSLCEAASLGPDVVPHTLRHTCATWLSQRGASMTDAAAFLGMSQATYERVYRKHSPTLRGPGFVSPPIWEIFDPKYHPTEILVDDDGWLEEEAASTFVLRPCFAHETTEQTGTCGYPRLPATAGKPRETSKRGVGNR
jgi:integrase